MSVIKSILDNDLYKSSMQQAVLRLYPEVPVTYQFTDRAPSGKMSETFHQELREEINAIAELRLTDEEADFLRTIPFLSKEYIEYLKNFHLNADHVQTEVKDGNLSLAIAGSWVETILWEVPLMAAISEVYFRQPENCNDWSEDRLIRYVFENTYNKGSRLNGLRFTDFGTRRRRSYECQHAVVSALSNFSTFQGTSNVHLARTHGVKVVGTMAHEFIMGVSAMEGLNRANWHALTKWNEVYKGRLGIALTDTFGTDAFWKDFDGQLSRLYDGARHDSGDPYKFADAAIAHYENMGIYPPSKTIVFSDGLTTEKCLELAKAYKNKISVAFGVGTHFSNDIPDSPALKIVIKLRTVNGRPVVKISDEPGKMTGDRDAVRVAKYVFFNEPLDNISDSYRAVRLQHWGQE